MERTTEILEIKSIDQIPSIEVIREIPRGTELKLVFEGIIQQQREAIGSFFKRELDGFLVGIHINEPEININKLITELEIEINQLFFEKCARDYRSLAIWLINKMAKELGIDLVDNEFKDETNLNTHSAHEIWEMMQSIVEETSGRVGDWNYFMHGLHIHFTNVDTKQTIEVSISHGDEYGVLDPYFFSQYILSTKQYYPLPVEIYKEFHDGCRIIDKMVELGKFEMIPSYRENEFVPVVKDK